MAAAAATAAAEPGTHPAAALTAGPLQAPWLGSGRSRRADHREEAAKHTREPRALPGEQAVRPPEVNPARSAAPRLRSSRRPPPSGVAGLEAVYREMLARIPLEHWLLRTDSSLRKAGSSYKLRSLK